MKIAIATGTRADWGLLSRLAQRLSRSEGCEVQIIVTNMHLNPAYGDTLKEIFRDGFTPAAKVPCNGETMAQKTAQVLIGMDQVLKDLKPDKIVILGDRFEMLATAIAAMMNQVPIVHIAGGETTMGAMDDKMRHAITLMASQHLVTTEPYRDKVISLGADPDTVVVTGNPGVDDAVNCATISLAEIEKSVGFTIPSSTFLVTFHPATLDPADPCDRFKALLDALDRYPDNPVIITYPNNDHQGQRLIEMINDYGHRYPERVHVIPNLGHMRYLSLLPHIASVIGNSSSGICEVPSSGTPTVNIGNRQQGRLAADSVIHCGNTTAEITQAIAQALQRGHRPTHNPYYHPGTLDLMTQAILKI